MCIYVYGRVSIRVYTSVCVSAGRLGLPAVYLFVCFDVVHSFFFCVWSDLVRVCVCVCLFVCFPGAAGAAASSPKTGLESSEDS